MIRVACPQCGTILAVKDDLAGKRGKCPQCKTIIHVPESEPESEQSPDPLVAMASTAATSIVSATGNAASIVGGAIGGLFKRTEKPEEKNAIVVQNDKLDSGWLSTLTRDNQSPDIVRAVADKVNTILMSGEELAYIAVQNKPVLNLAPDCIALTNKRFIFYRPKLLGRVDFEDYVWRELHDAKLSENMIGSTIRILAANGKTLSMDYLPKSQARAVYRIAQEMEERSLQERRDRLLEEKRAAAGGVTVQTNVAVPAQHPQPITTTADDPVQKLQKLKTMLDADLITQAEYDAKKAEILSSM